MVITGAKERTSYAYETVFGTKVTGTKPFGYGAKIRANIKSDNKEILSTGQRGAQDIVQSHYEGEGEVEAVLSDNHIFKGVFGAHAEVAATPYAGNYQHTYTIDSPPSLTISESNNEATPFTRFLEGCMIDSFSLSVSKDDPTIPVKYGFKYAKESADAAYMDAIAPVVSPFYASQSTLSIDSSEVDFEKCDIEVSCNAEMWIPANEVSAKAGVAKQFTGKLTFTIPYESLIRVNEILTQDSDTFTLTITNGATDNTLRRFIFSGTIYYESVDKAGVTTEEILKQTIVCKIKSLQCVAVDAAAI